MDEVALLKYGTGNRQQIILAPENHKNINQQSTDQHKTIMREHPTAGNKPISTDYYRLYAAGIVSLDTYDTCFTSSHLASSSLFHSFLGMPLTPPVTGNFPLRVSCGGGGITTTAS